MTKQYIVLALGLFLFTQAHADIWGVEDAVLIAKTAEQIQILEAQLEKAKSTYDAMTTQINKVDSLVKHNSGHYGFGNLKNTLSDLQELQWSPDSWSQALAGEVGHSAIQYRQLLESYQKKHTLTKKQDFEKGAKGNVVKNYEQSAQVNQAASVQSEYAFNEVNKSLKRIHDLSQQIERADNTKASVDLNSRLLTEVAYLQTQNLKAQSIVNQQLAQKQAVELSEKGDNSKLLAFDDDY